MPPIELCLNGGICTGLVEAEQVQAQEQEQEQARAHAHTHARTHAHTHTGLFWNYTRSLLTLYQVSFDTVLVSSDVNVCIH